MKILNEKTKKNLKEHRPKWPTELVHEKSIPYNIRTFLDISTQPSISIKDPNWPLTIAIYAYIQGAALNRIGRRKKS